MFGGTRNSKPDDLIAFDSGGLVDRVRVKSSELQVGLGPDDEECSNHVESKESIESYVASIHDVEASGLRNQFVEDIDVVQQTVADAYKGGNIAP